jgi:probable F420-dependent oxidoreductase
VELGRIGIWGRYLREAEPAAIVEAAGELEELGFGAIWIPGGIEADGTVFDDVARLLRATRRTPVATGIVNMWLHEPDALTAAYHRVESDHPERFLLGIGISHRPLVDEVRPGEFNRPFAAMVRYLDALDAQPAPVPVRRRVIAALGPKMLKVSAERSLGTHPYIAPIAHTEFARRVIGPDALLAPGVPVVLDSDPARARDLGRRFLATPYSRLPNYSNMWLAHGFTEADLVDGGSDRLIDGLVAWGDEERVAARIREHLEAGADHVCLHVIDEDRARLPREQWRRLGSALDLIPPNGWLV